MFTGLEDRVLVEGSIVPPNESRTIEERILSVRIERIMAKMKPEQADLLRKVYWEHHPQREIADELGISQQAVSQRLATAEGALKRAIAEHGGDDDVLNVGLEDL